MTEKESAYLKALMKCVDDVIEWEFDHDDPLSPAMIAKAAGMCRYGAKVLDRIADKRMEHSK